MLTSWGKYMVRYIVATRTVKSDMDADEHFAMFVGNSLRRFLNNDWGNSPQEDKEENDKAIEAGDRILASYKSGRYPTVWIIADAVDDYHCREAITILYPHEY